MNKVSEITKSLEHFFRDTRVGGLTCVSFIPDSVSSSNRSAILARKRSSWFNEKSGNAIVYAPGVNGYDKAFWQSLVLYAGLERFGLSWLCKDKGTEAMLLDTINRSAGESYKTLNQVERHMRSLIDRKDRKPESWSPFTRAIAIVFGLEDNTRSMNWAVQNGMSSYCWTNKVATEKTANVVKGPVAEKVDIENDKAAIRLPKYIELGSLGEPFRRVGYPSMNAMFDTERLVSYFRRNGVDEGTFDVSDIAEKFNDPMAIIKLDKANEDGLYSYRVILDKEVNVPGYGNRLLAFDVGAPEQMVSNVITARERGKEWKLFASPTFFSEKSVLTQMSHNVENWKYLKPKGGPDSDTFEIADRLQRNKRIGTTPAPGATSGLNAQSLIYFANLAKKFRNPMSSGKFLQMFGYDRDPLRDVLNRQASAKAESERMDAVLNQEPYVHSPLGKMDQVFPKSVIDGPARERLFGAGIRNAGDVAREGFDRVRELVGTDKAVNQIAGWMADHDIYVFPKETGRQVGEKPDMDSVEAHFHESIMKIGNVRSDAIVFPRRLSGEVFNGSDAVHLMAAGALMKTKGCPYWVTEGELLTLGCKPGKAPAVPVGMEGSPVNMYNLGMTEFPKRYAAEFEKLMDTARREFSEEAVPRRYFSVILGTISETARRNMRGLVAWMDNSDSDSFKALRSLLGSSIKTVLGEDSLQEMKRKGKTLKMYEAVRNASERVKQKGQRK